MKKWLGRRGLSPVVASALMILLVLVLAAIIFLWARGFIGEQIEKFGEPIEQTCSNVKFDAVKYAVGAQDFLEIRNTGNIDIRELEIKMTKEGNSESKKFSISVESLKSASQGVDFTMTDNVIPDKIVVYPALVGNSGDERRVFTCLDAGVTLS